MWPPRAHFSRDQRSALSTRARVRSPPSLPTPPVLHDDVAGILGRRWRRPPRWRLPAAAPGGGLANAINSGTRCRLRNRYRCRCRCRCRQQRCGKCATAGGGGRVWQTSLVTSSTTSCIGARNVSTHASCVPSFLEFTGNLDVASTIWQALGGGADRAARRRAHRAPRVRGRRSPRRGQPAGRARR